MKIRIMSLGIYPHTLIHDIDAAISKYNVLCVETVKGKDRIDLIVVYEDETKEE